MKQLRAYKCLKNKQISESGKSKLFGFVSVWSILAQKSVHLAIVENHSINSVDDSVSSRRTAINDSGGTGHHAIVVSSSQMNVRTVNSSFAIYKQPIVGVDARTADVFCIGEFRG